MITGIVDTGLITSTVITRGTSNAAFGSGVGLPAGIFLSGTTLLPSLTTVITRKSFKNFTVKLEKRDSIKLFAQIKNQYSQYRFTGNAGRRYHSH